MDLSQSRELLHRVNMLWSRGVISSDTRIHLRDVLLKGPYDPLQEKANLGCPPCETPENRNLRFVDPLDTVAE